MGYLFLSLALLASITKGYCGKRTSAFATKYDEAFLFNFLRMFFCILLGAGILAVQGELPALAIGTDVILPTVLSGISTSLFVVSWLIAVRTGALILLDVFIMLGVLITVFCSWLVFDEPIGVRQMIGLAILLAAVILMCSYNNSIKGRLTPKGIALLIVCGVSNGVTDFSQKLFAANAGDTPIAVFNFYTYVVSAVVLLAFFLAVRSGMRTHSTERPRKAAELLRPVFGYVLVMSACLYAYSYFKTAAAALLPAVQLYPLHQGGSLLLSSLMAAVVFKEKLTAKAVIGLFLAFAALLCINL